MKASVDTDASLMTVTMRGLDVVRATRRRMVVPLGHVKGARRDLNASRHGPWLGAGRTHALLDYAVAAGPMLVYSRREFWAVHDPQRAVAIDLVGEHRPDDRPRGRASVGFFKVAHAHAGSPVIGYA
jgi:hypothetical protein